MSDNEEKKPLKMYPGVSLGSAPKKRMSKLKVFLLIIIVVVGASAGGYWINREFINSEPEIPDIVEIVETDPQPVIVKEDTQVVDDLDLDLTQDTTEEPLQNENTPAATEPESATLEIAEATTNNNDDLQLDNILEPNNSTDESQPNTPDTLTTTQTDQTTTETTVTDEDIIDTTINAVSDTVEDFGEVINDTVSELSSDINSQEDILAALKQSDTLIGSKDYQGAANVLSRLTSLPTATLGNLAPDVYYRAGLAGRYNQDEKTAQENWLKAYQNFPTTISGRLAALALGETWFYWYAGTKPDYTKWEAIRDAYSTAIGMDGARFLPRATEDKLAQRLSYLNEKLIFDPTMPVSGAIFHRVEPGEYISNIARKYGLGTWSSIVDINKVDPKNLKVGMTLKVMPGRLFILVDKKNFTLSWYLDGKFIKRYKCATGAEGSETPAGHYEVFKMDVEPNWTDPNTGKVYKYGEEGHAIGSRWLAIRGGSKNGLGIHGTIDPQSIGKKASNGCIRLLNKDVEELYGFASIANNNESEVLVIE